MNYLIQEFHKLEDSLKRTYSIDERKEIKAQMMEIYMALKPFEEFNDFISKYNEWYKENRK